MVRDGICNGGLFGKTVTNGEIMEAVLKHLGPPQEGMVHGECMHWEGKLGEGASKLIGSHNSQVLKTLLLFQLWQYVSPHWETLVLING